MLTISATAITTPMSTSPNQSAAPAPTQIATATPLIRRDQDLAADHAERGPRRDFARGDGADGDGHRLRAGIAAHRGDDRHQDGERHHLLDGAVEQADHRGGEEGRDDIDQEPGDAAPRHVADRVGGLLVADAGELADVLVRLLLDDVDDVVDRDHADQPLGLVDHRRR